MMATMTPAATATTKATATATATATTTPPPTTTSSSSSSSSSEKPALQPQFPTTKTTRKLFWNLVLVASLSAITALMIRSLIISFATTSVSVTALATIVEEEILVAAAEVAREARVAREADRAQAQARIGGVASTGEGEGMGSKTPLGDHPHAGARYPDGTYGFVADVTAVRNHYLQLYQQHRAAIIATSTAAAAAAATGTKKNATSAPTAYKYREDIHPLYTFLPWDMIATIENKTQFDFVCNTEPGRGFEQQGYPLLNSRIQVNAPEPPPWNVPNTSSFRVDTKPISPPLSTSSTSSSSRRRSTILCVVYTYDKVRHRLDGVTSTWGWRCDGFFAASTITQFNPLEPGFGMVDLPHFGNETYGNMWQKTRSLIAYIYDHYLNNQTTTLSSMSFDYVYVCGDDTHLIVENLRNYLHTLEERLGWEGTGNSTNATTNNSNRTHDTYALYLGNPIILPFRLGTSGFAGGGSGYILNRAAIRRFIEHPKSKSCNSHQIVSAEDRYMGLCLDLAGVHLLPTHDDQHRIRFHGLDPINLYIHRARDFYLTHLLKYQTLHKLTKTLNLRSFDLISTQSVSLHILKKPEIMKRIHAILYRSCPLGTKLGDAQYAWDQANVPTSPEEIQQLEQKHSLQLEYSREQKGTTTTTPQTTTITTPRTTTMDIYTA